MEASINVNIFIALVPASHEGPCQVHNLIDFCVRQPAELFLGQGELDRCSTGELLRDGLDVVVQVLDESLGSFMEFL